MDISQALEEKYKQHQKAVESRLENNLKILDALKTFFTENPELRFIQGLYHLIIDSKDRFYEESDFTLERIESMTKKKGLSQDEI